MKKRLVILTAALAAISGLAGGPSASATLVLAQPQPTLVSVIVCVKPVVPC